MLLKPNPVPGDLFTRSTDQREWTADISDLGPHPFGRVYDDGRTAEGLTFVHPVTGRETVFVVTDTLRDREGDITTFVLTPADPAAEAMVGATIRLYND